VALTAPAPPQDVRLMYIDAFGASTPASGAFFVYDLVTEVGSRVRGLLAAIQRMAAR
jgi:hypothetical protein